MLKQLRLYLGISLLFGLNIGIIGCSDKEEVTDTTYFFDHLNYESDYVIITGDTQYYYTEENPKYLQKSINWISEAIRKGYRIQAVLHPGDVTNINAPSEWKLFREIISVLGKRTFIAYCTGNHDYTIVTKSGKSLIEDRATTHFPDYLKYNSEDLISTYQGDHTNALLKTKLLGEDYYVLSLEFGPREEVLLWADKLIKKYSQSKFILLTHAFLYKDNMAYNYSKYGKWQTWNPKTYFLSTDVNDGNEIWEHIIRGNANVEMVVCGHNSFSGIALTKNDFAKNVLQIRFDPTDKPHGGDGWLQILEFSKNERDLDKELPAIRLKGFIYNPIYNTLDTIGPGNFNLTY